MSSQVTILQLPAAGAITGTESVPIVQNGVTVQTTTGAIAAAPSQVYSYLTVTQTPQLPNSRYVGATNGLTLTDGGAQGLFNISTTGALLSLVNSSAGIQVKTNATTLVNRSVAVSGAGLSVTNGDGIAGDPTLSLTGQSLNFANASFNGLVVLSTAGAITSATITGTANQIGVANGNGIGGNPTISLSNNPVLPGVASATLPIGATADRPVSAVNGMIRYNTDIGLFEGYINGSWQVIAAGSGVTSVGTGTGLTGGPITSTGTISIANTAVTAASYGSASEVGTFTVNAQGQLTAAANATISIPASAINTTIPNSGLTNSSITVGTTGIALGASSLTLGGLTSVAVTQDPTSALQLATKQYVDAVAEGLHIHAPSAAATPGTLASITGGTVTYSNGTAGVGATLTLSVALTVLDGYTLLNGDRVLVKNEVAQANNGIYTWATGGTVLTRATDFDTAAEMASGDFSFVTNGTLYANTGWVQTDPVTVVGTSPVTWIQFSGAGTYTAGTGLTLTGTQFSLTAPVTAALGGSGYTSYATGDILYASASTTLSKLTIGASNYVLTSSGTSPQYVAQSTLSVGSATTATTSTNLAGGIASQIPYQTAAGATSFIANGTAGQVLTSAGTSVPTWSGISGGTF
jgi:hypothetical protein